MESSPSGMDWHLILKQFCKYVTSNEMHIIILNESQDMGMVGWLKQLFQWRHPRVWYNTDDHLWDMIYVPKEGTVTSFLKWKRVEIWRKILIEGFLVDPTWNSPN